MKLSVSLPEDVVGFIDEYARRHGMSSRSAVIHRAIERGGRRMGDNRR